MEGVYKLLLAAAISAILTGAGAWFTWARDSVSEAEAIDLIESRSPYVEDRKVLRQNVEETAKLREAVTELTVSMEGFKIVLQHALDHEAEHGDER